MFSIRRAVTGLALAGAIAVPAAAFAQQAAPQPDAQTGQHERHRGGFMHRFADLNLSDQQKTQIQQIMQNFRQSRQQGERPDPQAMQQLRDQINAVLTPDQRAKLAAETPQAEGSERMGGRGHFFKAELKKLNLTPQQQQKIDQLQSQFKAAHPQGSAPDPQARRQLREQVMNVLTPQQRTQMQNDMQQWRAQHPRPNPTATP